MDLSKEELDFITLTIAAANVENAVQVQSYYSGKPALDPDLSFELSRSSQEAVASSQISLMYGFSYHFDPESVTVGQRDRALSAAIEEVHSFWYDSDFQTLSQMSSETILNQLAFVASKHSTNSIQLSVVPNYFVFQTARLEE